MPPKFKKPAPSGKGPRVLYWFRTDLRVHDSPALTAALDLQPSVFIPIWTWDPHYVYRARVGVNRWKFLLECQGDLSQSLTELNSKQKLHVVRENPNSVITKLVKKWKITHLVFEKDTDAYARSRDDAVAKAVKDLGVEVIIQMGRTLFDPDELVKHNGGKPTMSMSQVAAAAKKINNGHPAKPLAAPTSLPDPLSQDEMDLSDLDHEVPDQKPDFNEAHRQGKDGQNEKHYHSIMGPNKDFAVVTLEEMGIEPSHAKSPHKGGEKEALRLLQKYIDDEEYIGTFEKPNSAPTDFEPQSTTLLSPHHHFGSLSIRKFWWDVQDVFEKRRKAKKHVAGEPANFPGQLLFRDMYFGAQAALGWSFAQTQGNEVARFIDWHLQSNYSSEPLGEHLLDGTYNVDNVEAEEWFRRWKEARTGFPWIDALMRQLRDEGWIHHLGRHAVACFLTRGGCYVHWERGAEVFEEWLIDHETACNVGNWMWLSCTAFFSQFYRCYSPVTFPKKWDPEGNFIRKYVPELKHYDKKYIFEPHKAPIADQKKWGCQIKGDGSGEEGNDSNGNGNGNEKMATYPKPMFDFQERRQICLDRMKAAYDKHLYGNDPKVMSGEWKKIFDYQEEEGMEVKDETNGTKGIRGKDSGGQQQQQEQQQKKKKQGTKRGHSPSLSSSVQSKKTKTKTKTKTKEEENEDESEHDDEDDDDGIDADVGDVTSDDDDDDNNDNNNKTSTNPQKGQKKNSPTTDRRNVRKDGNEDKDKDETKETVKGGKKKQVRLDRMVERRKGNS